MTIEFSERRLGSSWSLIPYTLADADREQLCLVFSIQLSFLLSKCSKGAITFFINLVGSE